MNTATEVSDELETYYDEISRKFDQDNPTELITHLERRCQLLARSAVLLADAQFIHDKARGEAASGVDMPATALREYLLGKCADEARLLKLADRLNSTIVHQIDSIRTMISYTKQLMNS